MIAALLSAVVGVVLAVALPAPVCLLALLFAWWAGWLLISGCRRLDPPVPHGLDGKSPRPAGRGL